MQSQVVRAPRSGFTPGQRLGILLSLVQVVIQGLLFSDAVIFLIIAALLFYVLTPFVVRLRAALKGQEPVAARALSWQCARTCVILTIIADGAVYAITIIVLSHIPLQVSGLASLGFAVTIGLVGLGLLVLNLVGLGLAGIGAGLGGLIGTSVARRRAPVLRLAASAGARRPGPWRFGLFMLIQLGLVGLQFLVCLGLGQGLFPTFTRIYSSPAAAFNPYSLGSVSLALLGNQLSEQAQPDSYLLRAGDGRVMQKVGGAIWASDQGILYTTTGSIVQETLVATRASDGQQLWAYTPAYEITGLQLVDGIIYFEGQPGEGPGVIIALDAHSGQRLWQHGCNGAATNCGLSSLGISHGIVSIELFTSGSIQLVALRARDGFTLWTRQLLDGALHPLLADDRIIATTQPGTLSAFQQADGQLLWQVTEPTKANEGSLVLSPELTTRFLVLRAGRVFGRSLATGALLWQRPLSTTNQKIYLSSQAVYLLSNSQGDQASSQGCPCVSVLSASDGQPLWEHTFGGGYSDLRVLGESQGVAYLQASDASPEHAGGARLFALRIDTGSLVWQRDLGSPQVLPWPGVSASAGAEATLVSSAPSLLVGATIYAAYQEIVTNANPPPHFVISVANALLPRTMFILVTQALDADSGQTRWQQKQSTSYQIL